MLLLSPTRGRPDEPTVREALTRNWPSAKSIPAELGWVLCYLPGARPLPRQATDANVAKQTLSWSRGTLHMRRQRRSLQTKEGRTEHETRNLQVLGTCEGSYHKLLPRLWRKNYDARTRLHVHSVRSLKDWVLPTDSTGAVAQQQVHGRMGRARC